MAMIDAAPAVRRRTHVGAPRRRQVVLRFSDHEYLQVAAAARAEGLAVGAWLGQLATREAATRAGQSVWSLTMSPADVVGALVRVRVDVAHGLALLALSDAGPTATADGPALGMPVGVVEAAKVAGAALARLDVLVDRVVDDVS